MKSKHDNSLMTSRRKLLVAAGSSALGFAGGFGGNLVAKQFGIETDRVWSEWDKKEASPRKSAQAMKNRGVVTRKSISSLALDSDEYLMFQDAVGVMRARSERDVLDPGGWISHATNHGLYCSSAVSGLQVHWSWIFLPWHRAYLKYIESAMAAAIGESSFALPYWESNADLVLPEQYWGDGNPLLDVTRGTEPGHPIPAEVVDMNAVLSARDFTTFGGLPYTTDDQEFTDGVMETHMHNCVHNWVGGNMGNAFLTAGFDPVFTGHHGNIDRAWAAWAAMEGNEHPDDKQWLETTFTFDNWQGNREQIQIKDLLDTEELGYQFDTLDFVQPHIEPPTLNGESVGYALDLNTSQRKVIANNIDSGRRYLRLSVNRPEWPFTLCPARVFLGVEGETPDYVTSVAPLPNILGGAKRPNAHIGIQVAVRPHLAEAVEAGKKLEMHLEYIQLKGQPPVPRQGVFSVTGVEYFPVL